ncbi:MAG: single-stranded-DNA-specific exonuclease RecJ [Clostridia bacterium]|nr:single-stranded-DNA-specific exonuclease RecJ [Clostridia bacterium]
MLSERKWVHRKISNEEIERTAKAAGISTLLSRIFLSRGIEDISYIKKFLEPSLEELHDPFLLTDMEKGVERILLAIEKKEKIIIYGDYDVDGVTSTSILTDFLLKQGAYVEYFIPDRKDEGYGLSVKTVDKILKLNASLIITVDCGVTALKEVQYINENGMDIIITDHHECKEVLPEAIAVINPCRPDCKYPFKVLAGVGIVYKLVQALCSKKGLSDAHNHYLDLVATGTVADVVPLIGENRIIVHYGIKMIEKSSNLGLKMLLEHSGMKDKSVNSWTIGFVIAPRINVAGRIGDASRAVRLFTTESETEAKSIVSELNDENRYRQESELQIYNEVLRAIDIEVDLNKEKVIVVAGKGWHHGIIGIVASRVTEKFYRPSILISLEENMGKGSGRSIEGFNLFKALSTCETLFETYGGHELAAGLTIKEENIALFREKINAYAAEVLKEYDLIPKMKVDCIINKNDITLKNIYELNKLAPFGAHNPSPLFQYDGITVNDIRTVGEDKHLKAKFVDSGSYTDAIGFNMGRLIHSLNHGERVDVVCSLEINSWNSMDKIQLNLKDLRICEEISLQDRFFYSLEKCRDFQIGCENKEYLLPDLNEGETEGRILNEEQLAKVLHHLDEKRVVFVLNSLQSVKKLENFLKSLYEDIKKTYEICYTSTKHSESEVVILVNPDIDSHAMNAFDQIIFFGCWINKNYLLKLMSGIDRTKLAFCSNIREMDFDLNEIILDRQDLVAVYQFLKSNSENNNLFIGDLCAFARKISKSYKIKMNYFKLKKSLEIFNELKLLNFDSDASLGVKITLSDYNGKKTNLDNSILYRNLQSLKCK